ncbi:MAG: hypothetical protein DRP89_01600 [Candidatus Neomarinimicrobiota bacterium]|nr:MAG: hypothetical protein DRP89_01600 [Candidatus Neomarinimicrobiota bacterium]
MAYTLTYTATKGYLITKKRRGSKMRKLTNFFLITLVIVGMFSSAALAGEKPIRLELKLGTPNLFGFSGEYLLPELGIPAIDKTLAPYFDFSKFTLGLDPTVDLGFTYFGFGAKYYLDQYIDLFELPDKMYGTYTGLGFGRLSITLTDEGWDDYYHGEGKSEGSVGLNMLQFKIGKRWIWGPITLCIESGYSLGKIDEKIEVEVEYEDGYKETETEDTSDIPIGGGIIGALSIGLAL